ncbi:MAG: hypothetical protein DPW16_04315 [Chloroflexi bacterium]|nr:hypothetical protein [Chloroflexota bacterium]
MMKKGRRNLVPIVLSITLLLMMFAAMSFQAIAQDGATATPTPSNDSNGGGNTESRDYYAEPASSTGDAEWTIEERSFTSNYPNGFQFSARVSSSKGDIENATVMWSHAPRNQGRRAATYDESTGLFTSVYDNSEGTPPWVAVNYRWILTDTAGNTYRSEWFMGEEYYDNRSQWERFESEDIIVFVEEGLPDDTGQQTLDAMAAQRETYRQAWGDVLSYRPRAILFSNRASFDEWRVGQGNPNVIGQTNAAWGGIVQVVSGGGVIDLAWGTVLHEVGHLYQDEFVPAGLPVATWQNEGNATLFELYQMYDYEQRVRDLAASGQLPALLIGSGPSQNSQGPDGRNRLGYDMGYVFYKWFVEVYGLDAHRQLTEILGPSVGFNAALEQVTGLTTQEIERRWRTWLGASPDAPTPIPIPTMRFPPTVTPFIFPTASN